jgi:hypothetical protein
VVFAIAVSRARRKHADPVELRYVGSEDAEDLQGNFWVSNRLDRVVKLFEKSVEKAQSGAWVCIRSNSAPQFACNVSPYSCQRFGVNSPSGLGLWRVRFGVILEAKGLVKYLHDAEFALGCVFRGGFLPRLTYLRRPFLFESAEVVTEVSTK